MFPGMRRMMWLAIVLGACGSKAPVPKDPVDKKEPVVEEEEAPPKPRTREQQIADAIARVPTIRAGVSEIRQLPSTDVVAGVQTVADFEAFVRAEAAKEVKPEEAKAESRALAHLGLLAEDVDLLETYIATAVSQVAAYYDPDTKQFQVVQVPEDDQMFDMVSAHELNHAVQDQNFDLKAFMPVDLTDDAGNARKFLVEGEATLIMLMYLQAQAGMDPNTAVALTALRGGIGMMAAMDPSQLGGAMGPNPAAEAAADLPPWIIDPMVDSYMKGAMAVSAQLLAGGWTSVDALYKAPPTTTEQMLHPAEKLVCHREEPVEIKLPDTTAGKGWKKVSDGVMGELGVRVYGKVWSLADRDAVAAGWNGDRWLVVEKGKQTLSLFASAWDTEADAKEFASMMEASLTTRAVDGQVVVSGDRVDVVIGCKAKACKAPLAAMAKLHKGAKPAPAREIPQAEADCLVALR